MKTGTTDETSRLARRLTLFDAVVIGLGSMIGAGVFAAVGPAARSAGGGLLVGLAIAAFVAYCAVLTYYAIANASAWTLPQHPRRWPRTLAALGLVGCGVLAATLPARTVVTGLAVLGIGTIVWILRHTIDMSRSGISPG